MVTGHIGCERVIDCGLIDYGAFESLQDEIWAQVHSGTSAATAIICRHYPVITCGRRCKPGNLLTDASRLAKDNIAVRQVRRGGDITYHGPGQICVYPIINLRPDQCDLHRYMRCLEEFILDILRQTGVTGMRKPGLTGVWTNDAKVASIGIAVRDWVTFYGFALNVCADDLAGFTHIRPCGMDIRMTSVENILGTSVSIPDILNLINRSLRHDTRVCTRAG